LAGVFFSLNYTIKTGDVNQPRVSYRMVNTIFSLVGFSKLTMTSIFLSGVRYL